MVPPKQEESKSRPAAVKEWTAEHVEDWLHDKKFGDCTKLQHFSGDELEMLYSKYLENGKEFEEKLLRCDYEMDGPTSLRFTCALKKLFEAQKPGTDEVDSGKV